VLILGCGRRQVNEERLLEDKVPIDAITTSASRRPE